MFPILALGFAVGVQHAFEADHLAAVASLSSRARKLSDVVRHGLTWGLGHALTLLALGGGFFLLGQVVSEPVASGLEFCVGVMLVFLGAHALWSLRRPRAESEAHHHAAHFHWRTLAVGSMHGLAGSAALILLAASRVSEPVTGLLYIALFGAGSMLGMGALSAAIAVPLAFSARRLSALNRGLQVLVGAATIAIGGSVISAHW